MYNILPLRSHLCPYQNKIFRLKLQIKGFCLIRLYMYGIWWTKTDMMNALIYWGAACRCMMLTSQTALLLVFSVTDSMHWDFAPRHLLINSEFLPRQTLTKAMTAKVYRLAGLCNVWWVLWTGEWRYNSFCCRANKRLDLELSFTCNVAAGWKPALPAACM